MSFIVQNVDLKSSCYTSKVTLPIYLIFFIVLLRLMENNFLEKKLTEKFIAQP